MFSSASPRPTDRSTSKSILPTFARRLTGIALIAGVAAGLQAAPSLAETKIRAAMLSVPQILDPNFTVAWVSQYHGLMIYDVLFAVDMKGNPQPQMVDKYEVSDDGSTYKFTLRPGLKFSDGTPLKAADCVASLKRWGSKDNPLIAAWAAGEEWLDERLILTPHSASYSTTSLKMIRQLSMQYLMGYLRRGELKTCVNLKYLAAGAPAR